MLNRLEELVLEQEQILLKLEGEVESVEITNNGSNYVQGDILSFDGLGAGGNGFIIRIVGFLGNVW